MIRALLIFCFVFASPFADAFEVAVPGKQFSFPKDDEQHPNFKTEWWYFTGNVVDEKGREFGYQLTFFRNALGDAPYIKKRESIWFSDQLIMAHFAITDVKNQKHHSFEKLRRILPDLVGFETDPWKIHIEPWFIANPKEGIYELRASQNGIELHLDCVSTKPRVFQGDHGYSRKGADPGNASYYTSFTRMKTNGKLVLENQSYQVTGESWMDHEVSTSALDSGQIGWDWFAIQLNSGEELMIYQLRNRDGTQGEFSSGTWIGKDGVSRRLLPKDFAITPQRSWKSNRTKTSFPVKWNVIVPSLNIHLDIQAKVDNQEMETFIPYWEGAIDVSGSHTGQGYLELTGYSGELTSLLSGKK